MCDSSRKEFCPREERFEPDGVTIHPDFDRVTSKNDIALIRLKQPAKLFAEVMKRCFKSAMTFVLQSQKIKK